MRARLAVLLLALAIAVLGCDGDDPEPDRRERGSARPAETSSTPPNVLVVLTDDQAFSTLERMPFLGNAPGFTRFEAFFTNNPLCCPSRATLLTGLYSHHHGVETNLVAERFDDSSTLATWLDEAGYETGLFGKYLNEYPFGGEPFVPPGWDEFAAFTGDPGYFDYTLAGSGGSSAYGSAPGEYSTTVLADRVAEFIRSAERPFFAWFAPYAPHAPRTAAPADAGSEAEAPVRLPANFDRAAEEAPRWWSLRPPVSAEESILAVRGQIETLRAVDDATKRLLELIADEGEAERTVVLFLSDNGYAFGSHRNRFKDCPYEECIHVPLLVRWPGEQTVPEVDALTSNIDVAPTIAEIAGVEVPEAVDGESLVPLLTGERSTRGRPVLLRHVRYPRTAPSFWGLRTERWKYAVYVTGETELYDLEADPDELRNLAASPGHDDVIARLDARMRGLRDAP